MAFSPCRLAQPATQCWGCLRCGEQAEGKAQARIGRYCAPSLTSSPATATPGFHPPMTPKAKPGTGAGYWEDSPTGRLYLFNRPGLEEAAKGYDLGRVVLALESVGAIAKRGTGKHQAQKRLPDGSRPWLYFIDPDKLEPET